MAAPASLWRVDDDEGDLCRVCRSEAEETKPLIYPCKCSGSVRYVHSDCLQEWVLHSRKRHCEICGHHYTFTKVYPSSLPSAIPAIVYVRQSMLVAGRIAWNVFRICLAIVSWLVFLPCVTMANLRIILAGANYITSPSLQYGIHSVIVDSYAQLNATVDIANLTHVNATGRQRVLATIATNGTYTPGSSFKAKMVDDVKNFMAFVFRGQIITISIAGGLIGLILLREWIGQLDWHARPVVEETGELNLDDWVFRNGQALRFTEAPQNDNLDTETVVAADGEEGDATGEQTEGTEADEGGEGAEEEEGRARAPRDNASEWEMLPPNDHTREVVPDGRPSASDSHVEYAAPEQLHRPYQWPSNLDDLPAEMHEYLLAAERAAKEPGRREWPDVPVDVGDPGPSTAQCRAESESANQRPETELTGSEARRASDPGPRGSEDITERADPPPPGPAELRTDTELEDMDTEDGDRELELELELEMEMEEIVAEDQPAPDAPDELDGMGIDLIPEDEDDRPLDADDWDGIFEVVGFIGPLTGLFHNHVFVSFAMVSTLLILVGLPVVVGKLFLLWSDVRMLGDVLLGTLRLISVIVDIVFDIVASIVSNALVIPRKLLIPPARWIIGLITPRDFFPVLGRLREIVPEVLNEVYDENFGSGFSFIGLPRDSPLRSPDRVQPDIVGHVLEHLPLSDGFEALGGATLSLYKTFRILAVCVAGSPDILDTFTCLLVGYSCIIGSVVCVAIADAAQLIHLSESVVERARSVAMFLKVVFFMTLEIVLFPLFVGLIMDASTLFLFGYTLRDRVDRLLLRPFGTLFVAWLIGTIFMFSFATFLAHLRTICRRGALYFIRDPSDPSHSPVKDIIERPAMAQLPRLAISAVMYSLIAFSVCGAIPTAMAFVSSLGLFNKDFLPLRLEQRPLSSVPFDLLFLHLVLPPSWESLRVYHRLKKGLAIWWNHTVRALDLSSLILGIETARRPQSKVRQLTWLIVDALCQSVFGRYDNRATRARVPGNDRVELLPLTLGKREGMFIPLDHKGAPKTEVDAMRLLRQDRAARRAGRNPLKDYTVINLPDYWRTRIHVLVAAGLFCASLLVGILFFVPLAVGRLATPYLFDGPIFDGYSWLTGMYVCWGAFSLGQSTRKRIIQYGRAARLRRSGTSTRFKRAVLSYLTMLYSVVVLYLILPLLIGILFELYISLPIRYGISDITPVLHVWDAWGMGAALISLYVGGIGFLGEDTRGMRFREGFRRPLRQKFWNLNSFFLPLCVALVLPIVVPWCAFLSILTGLRLMGAPIPLLDYTWLFRVSYPLWSVVFVMVFAWERIKHLVAQIRQWMIDAEYVIEERVENYTPIDHAEIARELGLDELDETQDEWEDVFERDEHEDEDEHEHEAHLHAHAHGQAVIE